MDQWRSISKFDSTKWECRTNILQVNNETESIRKHNLDSDSVRWSGNLINVTVKYQTILHITRIELIKCKFNMLL